MVNLYKDTEMMLMMVLKQPVYNGMYNLQWFVLLKVIWNAYIKNELFLWWKNMCMMKFAG